MSPLEIGGLGLTGTIDVRSLRLFSCRSPSSRVVGPMFAAVAEQTESAEVQASGAIEKPVAEQPRM